MHSAWARREQELRELILEGVPLRTRGKAGHWILDRLHIFTASGRWLSEETGRSGRLNGHPMRAIIQREHRSIRQGEQPLASRRLAPSTLRRGEQLCPDAAQRTRQMELLYEEYDAFMTRSAKRTRQYDRIMRDAAFGPWNDK